MKKVKKVQQATVWDDAPIPVVMSFFFPFKMIIYCFLRFLGGESSSKSLSSSSSSSESSMYETPLAAARVDDLLGRKEYS